MEKSTVETRIVVDFETTGRTHETMFPDSSRRSRSMWNTHESKRRTSHNRLSASFVQPRHQFVQSDGKHAGCNTNTTGIPYFQRADSSMSRSANSNGTRSKQAFSQMDDVSQSSEGIGTSMISIPASDSSRNGSNELSQLTFHSSVSSVHNGGFNKSSPSLDNSFPLGQPSQWSVAHSHFSRGSSHVSSTRPSRGKNSQSSRLSVGKEQQSFGSLSCADDQSRSSKHLSYTRRHSDMAKIRQLGAPTLPMLVGKTSTGMSQQSSIPWKRTFGKPFKDETSSLATNSSTRGRPFTRGEPPCNRLGSTALRPLAPRFVLNDDMKVQITALTQRQFEHLLREHTSRLRKEDNESLLHKMEEQFEAGWKRMDARFEDNDKKMSAKEIGIDHKISEGLGALKQSTLKGLESISLQTNSSTNAINSTVSNGLQEVKRTTSEGIASIESTTNHGMQQLQKVVDAFMQGSIVEVSRATGEAVTHFAGTGAEYVKCMLSEIVQKSTRKGKKSGTRKRKSSHGTSASPSAKRAMTSSEGPNSDASVTIPMSEEKKSRRSIAKESASQSSKGRGKQSSQSRRSPRLSDPESPSPLSARREDSASTILPDTDKHTATQKNCGLKKRPKGPDESTVARTDITPAKKGTSKSFVTPHQTRDQDRETFEDQTPNSFQSKSSWRSKRNRPKKSRNSLHRGAYADIDGFLL